MRDEMAVKRKTLRIDVRIDIYCERSLISMSQKKKSFANKLRMARTRYLCD